MTCEKSCDFIVFPLSGQPVKNRKKTFHAPYEITVKPGQEEEYSLQMERERRYRNRGGQFQYAKRVDWAKIKARISDPLGLQRGLECYSSIDRLTNPKGTHFIFRVDREYDKPVSKFLEIFTIDGNEPEYTPWKQSSKDRELREQIKAHKN